MTSTLDRLLSRGDRSSRDTHVDRYRARNRGGLAPYPARSDRESLNARQLAERDRQAALDAERRKNSANLFGAYCPPPEEIDPSDPLDHDPKPSDREH
jgi:hypothetical protein